MSLVLPAHLTCRELVELVTAYAEDALDEEERVAFEEHLVSCSACVTYVDQMRQAVVVTGTLSEEAIDPDAERALLAAFRGLRRAEG